MGGKIKLLNLAVARELAGAGAEQKCFTRGGCFEPAAGCIGVRVTDKENRLGRIADHAHGQGMRGCVFAHHTGGKDKKAAPGEFHFFRLTVLQHCKIERFAQLQIGVLPMSPMRFEIVNLGENATKPTDIYRLQLELALVHQNRQEREDFLSASQRERRQEEGRFALLDALNGLSQTFDFTFAAEARRQRAIATRSFHDHHVCLHVLEAGASQEGLVVETNVTGKKEGLFLTTNEDSG